MVNNVSKKNLVEKANELLSVLKPEFFPYFARYLVCVFWGIRASVNLRYTLPFRFFFFGGGLQTVIAYGEPSSSHLCRSIIHGTLSAYHATVPHPAMGALRCCVRVCGAFRVQPLNKGMSAGVSRACWCVPL